MPANINQRIFTADLLKRVGKIIPEFAWMQLKKIL